MTDLGDDELRAELDSFAEPKKRAVVHTALEERVISGFEEIERFVITYKRVPEQTEGCDIFERRYATRLGCLRAQPEFHELLRPYDSSGLLTKDLVSEAIDDLDDDALFAELGGSSGHVEISTLTYVRSTAEKKAAEAIANRERCEDFELFEALFAQVQNELDTGLREARKFELKSEIEAGRFFIVGGQKAYVAEKGETTITDQGRTDARLRVIFDNGTESPMLMRSLQRALNADGDAGRRITEPNAGPLFADQSVDGDEASGIIYVLRSKSDHPMVAANRDLVHKIGVTTESVEKRIAGAHLQPTFLMSNVEIVATYDLFNINRSKLERLIHRIFDSARLEIEVKDRFGRPVVPQEWFLVPLFVIEEAVAKIKDGTITEFSYDPTKARLTQL